MSTTNCCAVYGTLLLTVLCFSLLVGDSTQQDNVDADDVFLMNVTFSPASLESLDEGDTERIFINYTCCPAEPSILSVTISDAAVAKLVNPVAISVPASNLQENVNQQTISGAFVDVRGERLGGAHLNLRLLANSSTSPPRPESGVLVSEDYRIIVQRKRNAHDTIYRYLIIVFSVLVYLGFGCEIEIKLIWSFIKKPVQLCIGAVCQFLFMPLIGFGVASALQLSKPFAFGLLTVCSSPGGGASNVWAKLLGGNINLSLTMTFFSSLLSLGFMPLWLFLLGRFFIDPSRVKIPYSNIVLSLLYLVGPCIVGLLIRYFLPKVAAKIAKFNKIFSLLFVLTLLTYGTYVNFYIFEMMTVEPKIIAAAMIAPVAGFLIGYIASLIFRQNRQQCITISIETGCQNPSIPIITLQGSFQQPEGDLGAVMPVAMAFFTPLPLAIIYCVLLVKRCLWKEEKDPEVFGEPQGEIYHLSQSANNNVNKENQDNSVVNDAYINSEKRY